MSHFLRHLLFSILLRHVAALGIVALTTVVLLPLNQLLGAQVVALVYLLPVLLATSLWGLTPGILAGFAAFLSFNYFFIPPYHTLAVHRSQDLITLIVFLMIGVFISQLFDQVRKGMELAKTREWEATRMYELISALAALPDKLGTARLLAEHTLETFHGRRVEVSVRQPPEAGVLSAVLPEGSAASQPPTVRVPMQTGRSEEGEICLWLESGDLSEEERRLLNTFASQGALAIERIRLSQSETKARILEEADRAKSSLLSSVSHELRSPLAAIKASASSLRSGLVDWDTAGRQDLLETIEEESDALNFLVGNLLDMSRIEAGALKPQRRWNSLAEIAMGVVKRMRKSLLDYSVETDFPADLPLAPSDYVLIDQVFTNLISNSVKFAPPGTTITIGARVEGDSIHVQVTNQGPPVPEESLERIFDKFNRVRVKDRVTSTGLGLSICKGIIEAHLGRIWAENSPCCFTFHFTLPLRLDGSLPDFPPEPSNE